MSLPVTKTTAPLPRGTSPSRATSIRSPMLLPFEFLCENGHALGTSLNAHRNTDMQDRHDLFRGRTSLERAFDVPARAGRIHVRDRRIEGDADQLDEPRGEDAALVDAGYGEGEEVFRPERGKVVKRVPRRVPQAHL